MNFFEKLKKGLSKTKENINENLNKVFSEFRKVDEELLEELEEALILADIGYQTSSDIIDILRNNIKLKNIKDVDEIKNELKNILLDILKNDRNNIENENKGNTENKESKEEYNNKAALQQVILVVGVNGVR